MNKKEIVNIRLETFSDYDFLEPKSSPKKSGNNSCIKWVYTPRSVNELINTENFKNYLYSGIIFFHNKAPLCGDLIKRLIQIEDYFQIIPLNISDTEIISFIEKISTKNASKKKIIYEVNINDKNIFKNIVTFINNNKIIIKYGLWIRSYINYVSNYIPDFFDGLFIFDTSLNEFELLKRKLDISDNTIAFLKENQNQDYTSERVLFYWNYEKNIKAPSIYANPIVLGIKRRLISSSKFYYSSSDGLFINNLKGNITMLDKKIFTNNQIGSIGDNSNHHNTVYQQ